MIAPPRSEEGGHNIPMAEDRVSLVRRFLEQSFAGHTVGHDWQEPKLGVHAFRVDDSTGTPRYWLAVSDEAMSDKDVDLAGKLTPALVQTLKDAGASRSVVMLSTDRVRIRTELP
jgi:hypothetical protein